MPRPELIDKSNHPDELKLQSILGGSKSILDRLVAFLKSEFGQIKPEWKFYSPKIC